MHGHVVNIHHRCQAGKSWSGLRPCFKSVHGDVIDDQQPILNMLSKHSMESQPNYIPICQYTWWISHRLTGGCSMPCTGHLASPCCLWYSWHAEAWWLLTRLVICRPCVFCNQSLLDNLNGLVTDHPNKISLLGKSTCPQLKGLGPIVFMYGLVVVITYNRGSTCFRFQVLNCRAYSLSCRALKDMSVT